MNRLQRLEVLKDFIEEAVDRGTASVEQIHQTIADLPFEALEKAGVLHGDRLGLRALNQRSIGLVYGAIRRINRGIGQALSDQFENIEETQEVSALLREPAPRTGKTAAVDPPLAPVTTVLPPRSREPEAEPSPTVATKPPKAAAAKPRKPARKKASKKAGPAA